METVLLMRNIKSYGVKYLKVEYQQWRNRDVRLLLRGVIRGPFARKYHFGSKIIDSGGALYKAKE